MQFLEFYFRLTLAMLIISLHTLRILFVRNADLRGQASVTTRLLGFLVRIPL